MPYDYSCPSGAFFELKEIGLIFCTVWYRDSFWAVSKGFKLNYKDLNPLSHSKLCFCSYTSSLKGMVAPKFSNILAGLSFCSGLAPWCSRSGSRSTVQRSRSFGAGALEQEVGPRHVLNKLDLERDVDRSAPHCFQSARRSSIRN